MKILTIIPARKGSSFHGKNSFPVNGRPMIEYTFDCIPDNMHAIVTTDDEWIIEGAKQHGLTYDRRPSELATNKATLDQVVYYMAKKYTGYDAYLMLPPTSPLRTLVHVCNAIKTFEDNKCDSLLSVTEERRSIWKKAEGYYKPIVEVKKSRQWIEPVYVANGAIFITSAKVATKLKKKVGGRTCVYVMDENSSVDVHNMEDIKKAEHNMKRGK